MSRTRKTGRRRDCVDIFSARYRKAAGLAKDKWSKVATHRYERRKVKRELTMRLKQAEADAVEAEMRALEADPKTTLRQMRLFMQWPMPCGHAAGNLLTCDSPPFGCVICNRETTDSGGSTNAAEKTGDAFGMAEGAASAAPATVPPNTECLCGHEKSKHCRDPESYCKVRDCRCSHFHEQYCVLDKMHAGACKDYLDAPVDGLLHEFGIHDAINNLQYETQRIDVTDPDAARYLGALSVDYKSLRSRVRELASRVATDSAAAPPTTPRGAG